MNKCKTPLANHPNFFICKNKGLDAIYLLEDCRSHEPQMEVLLCAGHSSHTVGPQEAVISPHPHPPPPN